MSSPPNGLDGYVNQLRILSVGKGRFFGSWQSSISYVFKVDSERRIIANSSGYFCAASVDAGRGKSSSGR
jgi:hypothetical protein